MPLKVGFIIDNKYEVTRQLHADGSTMVYMGKDTTNGRAVTVREFFSVRIMQRDEGGTVSSVAGREVQYKSLMLDYEEFCRYTMALEGAGGILCPIDVLVANGTCYCIEPAMELETLDDYLARNGGTMSWQRLKKLIAPIITTLRRMHADGFYHRGISPETVMVSRAGELMLSGLDIPAARTADSELEAKLFFGYSAPEQYSSASWQGSWTDVYSIAAVCYRALTGTTPVEWRQRGSGRQLLPPVAIESGVPENVSNTLMTALSVDLRNRYRTIEEMWGRLLHGPGDNTIVIDTTLTNPGANHAASRPHKVLNNILMLLGIMLLVLILSINVVTFIIDRYVGPPDTAQTSESSSSSYSSSTPGEMVEIVVPDLTGMGVEKVMQNKIYTQLFLFEIERVFSESQPVGVVVWQEPKQGTEVEERGETVVLHISMGSERATMPQVVGTPVAQATQLLSDREISYVIENVIDSESPVGTVIWSSSDYESVVYRTQTVVTLRVAIQD